MQSRKTFQELLTEGYEHQLPLPLPLPAVPGVRANRTTACTKCGEVHLSALDDVVCTHTQRPPAPS